MCLWFINTQLSNEIKHSDLHQIAVHTSGTRMILLIILEARKQIRYIEIDWAEYSPQGGFVALLKSAEVLAPTPVHMGFQISYFNLLYFMENILLDKQPECWNNPSLNILQQQWHWFLCSINQTETLKNTQFNISKNVLQIGNEGREVVWRVL